MDAISNVRKQLLPLVDALVGQLEADGDPGSAAWFRQVGAALEAARQEEDLLLIFLEQLGPTGPMADAAGFGALARLRLDQLLAQAEAVAFAFSATGDPH
ncbi:MAG: hypothetical protein JJU22_01855 [Gammaproteobacteria bacterium]|jgi:hypothetical protein|nr:hypothetical protein [Gammaproteobacteria bacterium]